MENTTTKESQILNLENTNIENKEEDSKNEDTNNIKFNLEDIFINLTLISRIEVGNKLIKNGKYVNIDTSYFQFITRWFNSQNRSDSINFTTNILSNAFKYSDYLSKHKDDESRQNLFRLNAALSNAIGGLSNLSQTYHYDKLTQSEIEVMINNIRTKLNIQSKHLHFVEEIEDIKKTNINSEVNLNSTNVSNNTNEIEKKDTLETVSSNTSSTVENYKREKKEEKHKENKDKDKEHRDNDHSHNQFKKKSL
jgi:hypothetical protein